MRIYCNMSWNSKGLFAGGKGGGPSTFMGYLSDYLAREGIETTNNHKEDYDIHFINIFGIKSLKKSLLKNKPIVLRQDNIAAAPNFERYWKTVNEPYKILRELSTEIIYISQYCKDAWDLLTGDVNKPEYVIHNGANQDLFNPFGNRLDFGFENVITMNENFRWGGKKQGLTIILEALKYVLVEKPNTVLAISGAMSDKAKASLIEYLNGERLDYGEHLKLLGPTTHATLPQILRSGDVVLHLIPNSACSHTVPEALSCGVPVIGYSGTGPAEFIGENGFVLKSEYEGVKDGFKRYPNEDPKQLADAILSILDDKKKYKDKARKNYKNFSSERTCENYLKVFENAMIEKKSQERSSYKLLPKYLLLRSSVIKSGVVKNVNSFRKSD